ncbi:MAG TPA: hypothetical protein VGE09_08285 [Pseudoxanthomonas sp.]
MNNLTKLLMAMAGGTDYIERGQHIILQEAAEEIGRLRFALCDARDQLIRDRSCVEEWAGYADEFFRNKYGLGDDLADIDISIARITVALTDPDFPEAAGLDAERGTGAPGVIDRSTP